MQTWDDMSDFYKQYAGSQYGLYRDFGIGMLDLIDLLQNDPEIRDLTLGRSMAWLLIALPDYDLQSIHIQWDTSDRYEMFLTPENDWKPDITTVALTEAVPKVKEYLAYLRDIAQQYRDEENEDRDISSDRFL